jgi:hypothetical protein
MAVMTVHTGTRTHISHFPNFWYDRFRSRMVSDRVNVDAVESQFPTRGALMQHNVVQPDDRIVKEGMEFDVTTCCRLSLEVAC